jgi:DNA polymerase-4
MLHGVDIQPPSSRYSKSIGHQHVLEPELRTNKGAHSFAQHLLTKAAERLRRGDYYCRRLGLHLSWIGDLAGWWDGSPSQSDTRGASASAGERRTRATDCQLVPNEPHT